MGDEDGTQGRDIFALNRRRQERGHRQQDSGSAKVAALAIRMRKTQAIVFLLRRRRIGCRAIVAMLVMPEMRRHRRSPCLVCAIAGGASPDKLELY